MKLNSLVLNHKKMRIVTLFVTIRICIFYTLNIRYVPTNSNNIPIPIMTNSILFSSLGNPVSQKYAPHPRNTNPNRIPIKPNINIALPLVTNRPVHYSSRLNDYHYSKSKLMFQFLCVNHSKDRPNND